MRDSLDPETIREAVWALIPDHCASAAVAAGSELDAEQVARRAGARTPEAQAAVIRATALRDQPDPRDGPIDFLDLIARPLPSRANWGARTPRWNGRAVCCPKGWAHRIGFVALRFGEDWQLELHNAGRKAAEHYNVTIRDATHGLDSSEREAATARALRAAHALLSVAADADDSQLPPDQRRTRECIGFAVRAALFAMARGDPDGVHAALEPTNFDPLLVQHDVSHPVIRQLIRLEDNAVRAAGRRQPWDSSRLTDVLQLDCPRCTYSGSHKVANLIIRYAETVRSCDTRLTLLS